MVTKPALLGRASFSFADRLFVYEVEGLRQNLQSDRANYAMRSSENTFITVPLNRMNEEMRRITRLGGKIVGIHGVSTAQNGASSQDGSSSPA